MLSSWALIIRTSQPRDSGRCIIQSPISFFCFSLCSLFPWTLLSRFWALHHSLSCSSKTRKKASKKHFQENDK